MGEILRLINKKDKKVRLMLDRVLHSCKKKLFSHEYLPRKSINAISRSSFVVKYVAPIIQAFVDSKFLKWLVSGIQFVTHLW